MRVVFYTGGLFFGHFERVLFLVVLRRFDFWSSYEGLILGCYSITVIRDFLVVLQGFYFCLFYKNPPCQVQIHLDLTRGTWAESTMSTSPCCRTYTRVWFFVVLWGFDFGSFEGVWFWLLYQGLIFCFLGIDFWLFCEDFNSSCNTRVWFQLFCKGLISVVLQGFDF